jgi:hypothetical protein
MDKIKIMFAFLKFCDDYKIIGRFDPGEMTFYLCSPSLGWTEISYARLQAFRPDLFPEELRQDSLF